MSGTTSTDMSITLKEFEEVTIGPLNLQYTEGDPEDRENTRQYDSCYYMITAELSQASKDELEDTYEEYDVKIHLTVSKATGMNVYLYGGRDRYTALEEIVPGNEAVTVGTTYTTDSDKGFLLVAYPDLDADTEFEYRNRRNDKIL